MLFNHLLSMTTDIKTHTERKTIRSLRLLTRQGPARLNPRDTNRHGQRAPVNPRSPASGTLSARGGVKLHVVNLRIVSATGRLVDIEMSLNLPVDIDHRAIGAVVRDQNLDLRRPVLLDVPAGDAAPEAVSSARRRRGTEWGCAHAQFGSSG